MFNQIPVFAQLSPQLREIVLRVLAVLLALLVIWILRSGLHWLLVTPLRRAAARTGSRFDDLFLDAATAPVRLVIIGFSLLVSAAILEVESSFITHLVRTLFILAVLLLTSHLIDLILPSSNRLFAVTGITIEERLIPFVRVATKFLLIVIGIVIILQEWGYDITGVIAGFGLGGLAFSLAAQDTVANLFGFIAIVGDRPFNVGDYIKTTDVEGSVEHVGLRSTRVRQLDQALVMVPNNKLANSAILNWSRLSKRRIDYVLGVKYSASSDQMRLLLDRIRVMLKSQPTVDPTSVIVNFIDFGNSALEVMIRAYINIADWGAFTQEKERLHLEVMDIIHDIGLEIAFPGQSLYIEHLPDLAMKQPTAPTTPPRELSPAERAVLDENPSYAPQGGEPDKQ